jgi:hypothetical protein
MLKLQKIWANCITLPQVLLFQILKYVSDFILDGAWTMPNLFDDTRFDDRVINNLIYYQTNYFVLGIALAVLVA